jgi:hypothetical protein
VFDGNIPTTEQILGLIPTCKIKQTLFNVTANYDPNILPEKEAGKVQTKIEGSDETVQVTSCHQLFENILTTKACKAEAEVSFLIFYKKNLSIFFRNYHAKE